MKYTLSYWVLPNLRYFCQYAEGQFQAFLVLYNKKQQQLWSWNFLVSSSIWEVLCSKLCLFLITPLMASLVAEQNLTLSNWCELRTLNVHLLIDLYLCWTVSGDSLHFAAPFFLSCCTQCWVNLGDQTAVISRGQTRTDVLSVLRISVSEKST